MFTSVLTGPKTSHNFFKARRFSVSRAVGSYIYGASMPPFAKMPQPLPSKGRKILAALACCRWCRKWRVLNGASHLVYGWSREVLRQRIRVPCPSTWPKHRCGDWVELLLRSILDFGEGWWTWSPSLRATTQLINCHRKFPMLTENIRLLSGTGSAWWRDSFESVNPASAILPCDGAPTAAI